jgi:hypothetical protein
VTQKPKVTAATLLNACFVVSLIGDHLSMCGPLGRWVDESFTTRGSMATLSSYLLSRVEGDTESDGVDNRSSPASAFPQRCSATVVRQAFANSRKIVAWGHRCDATRKGLSG